MGFVLEIHSRPWVQDLILHFVVAFLLLEGKKFPTFLFLSLVLPMGSRQGAKGSVSPQLP